MIGEREAVRRSNTNHAYTSTSWPVLLYRGGTSYRQDRPQLCWGHPLPQRSMMSYATRRGLYEHTSHTSSDMPRVTNMSQVSEEEDSNTDSIAVVDSPRPKELALDTALESVASYSFTPNGAILLRGFQSPIPQSGLMAAALQEESLTATFSPPCLLYTSPSPRDQRGSRMPSSA